MRFRLTVWKPKSMMALSVILIAWFGWQQYRTQTGDASLPDRVEQVVQSADSERESTGKPAIDAPGDRRGRAEQGRAAASASEESQRTPVESFQAPKQERDVAATPPPRDEVAQSDRGVRLEESFDDDASEAPAPDSPPGETESAPEAVAAERMPRSRIAPHESEPIGYWELPQGVRDDLPELRITVLVYAEEPEDRFLLMGGKRLLENEEVEGGLVLEEIRRDGAVFKYRKYRFLVKG